MAVVVAFTLSALTAAVVNTWFLVRSVRKRQALKAEIELGLITPDKAPPLRQIASAFIQIWVVILAVDVLLVVAGIGILEGQGKVFGYLLAVVPVAHVLYGIFALRGFETRSSG